MVQVKNQVNKIAFVGTYLPRQCGIATFTADLCTALSDASASCVVIPMDDRPEGYDYVSPVRFTVFEADLSSYRRAAEFLNINRVDVVSLQHEFGIFGGEAGSHVLALLQSLRAPVVTTFHTVLRDPEPEFRRVMSEVAAASTRVAVLSRHAQEFLRDVYDVPEEKIDLILHGIPDFPFVDPNFYKDQFQVTSRPVMLSFGLLSPAKGIENVIRALPCIKQAFPGIAYLVVGATHPYWIREEGEAYRLGLQRLARELDVDDNVIFHNRFVEADELVAFIGAADIFITPYLSEEQVSSGTLSWAIGAGKAVISTPYWYAKELLDEGRGVLVPFGEDAPIADAVIRLLSHDAERHAMRKRGYMYGRNMTWANVAHQYIDSFGKAMAQQCAQPRTVLAPAGGQRQRSELPQIRLQHLRRMTDRTGLLKHALHNVPRYEGGYRTDDNARALLLTMKLFELGELPEDVEDLAVRYLAFLHYAYDSQTGRFRNHLEFGGGRWARDEGSEDAHGRALWALGATVAGADHRSLRETAGELFERAVQAAPDLDSISARALTLLGIDKYLTWFSGDVSVRELRQGIAKAMLACYRENADESWHWFERTLSNAGARLPHSLLITGRSLGNDKMVCVALESLKWLCDVQHAESDHFVPIGSRAPYGKEKERARFDQLPIEACATVAACLAASEATGDKMWYAEAERTFEWFLGRNDHDVPLYDPRTGGCHDALRPDGVNANQGAEATLSYLLSLADMRLADKAIVLQQGEMHASEAQLSTR